MNRRIFLAGALAGLPAIAIGADKDKEKTLQQRLEGTWVRPNDPLSFKVDDKAVMTEMHQDKPFAPFNSGAIEYKKGQHKAIVRLKSGHTLWLFSAGPDVVAVAVLRPMEHSWTMAGSTTGRGLIRHSGYRRQPTSPRRCRSTCRSRSSGWGRCDDRRPPITEAAEG
jgi:hypothetical protein